MTTVSLAGLFCYSVLKDSFTMAFKDELTGIPSRRALMQYVQTLGRKYTVVMADIDHFKKFNDTYGHDVGDEVLKLVASKLDKVTGGGKTFRFGGEEFIIVFPRKTSPEVMPFVELVRQTIADYDIALRVKPRPPKPKKPLANKNVVKKPAKEKIVKVTTSFGVAQRTKEYSDFANIMKQADIALYAAKKAGRNCVKMAKQ
jgi:GGDEF domain-containing protein